MQPKQHGITVDLLSFEKIESFHGLKYCNENPDFRIVGISNFVPVRNNILFYSFSEFRQKNAEKKGEASKAKEMKKRKLAEESSGKDGGKSKLSKRDEDSEEEAEEEGDDDGDAYIQSEG